MITAARNFFNEAEQQRIIDAIRTAERNTSGEIRVHMENLCFGDALKKAKKVFTQLKMQETKDRNGILIYIAVMSRKIAVVGDLGIHKKLGNDYWDKIVKGMVGHMAGPDKADGLAKAIIDCGEQLKQHFPYASDDKNELDDSISFKA